jgi:MFS transporter, UMF1 family
MEAHPQHSRAAQERDYRRAVNAWAMYDWANSAFVTIILTAVFPVYYRSLVLDTGAAPAAATAYWAYTTSLSLVVVALVGPWLGAMADLIGAKKRFLAAALVLGVLGTASLASLGSGMFILGSVFVAAANLGFAGGNIFYESLLPHVARSDDLDRVSARGYALGYLGGGLLLVINVLWLIRPEWFWLPDRDFALRLCFLSVALWWLVFSLPLFRRVGEPHGGARRRLSLDLLMSGLGELAETFRELRRYRQLLIFLAAFWLYNDGINTIIKLAAAYGDEIGLEHNDMLIALILTQFIGFPCSIAFGSLARHFGTKRTILLGLSVYMLITVGGFFMSRAWHFYALAVAVGLVQGGTQALSRSLFAMMVPKSQSTKFFGFFSTGEKMAGIIGPAIFGLIGQATGSSRWGIISVVLLFVAGALLLQRLDEEEGRCVAETVEASRVGAQPSGSPPASA